MHIDLDNSEYNNIIDDILCNKQYKKIEVCSHHGISRLEHCKRVSFYSYKICKKLNLDYVSAARGGLLHDFFNNRYATAKKKELLYKHPEIALYNSKKHFVLNEIEEDIVLSHMFPINIKYKPRYRESYIITFVDKVACIYERYIGCKNKARFKLGQHIIYVVLLLSF